MDIIIALLKSEDAEFRSEALGALEYIRSNSMNLIKDVLKTSDLIQLLEYWKDVEEKDYCVVDEVVFLINEISGIKDFVDICLLLNSHDESFNKFIEGILDHLLNKIILNAKKEDVVYLIDNLTNPSDTVREYSAETLGEVKSSVAVSALCERLRDSSANVRAYSAEALGKIGSTESLNDLNEALSDEDIKVRHSVESAIKNIQKQ